MRRCSVAGDVGAWEEFVRRFHRLIAAVVLRTASRLGDPSTPTVDDLIQETYLKLCADNFRLLRSFDQRHPDAFLGYLRVVTVNVVRDYFKSAHARKRGSNQTQEFDESVAQTPQEDVAAGPVAIERAVLIEEIRGHLDLCIEGPEQDRSKRVFWLYYRAGLSAGAIAALPEFGLTTKGVESLILRVTKVLRERLATPNSGAQVEANRRAEGILSKESLMGRRSGFGPTPE